MRRTSPTGRNRVKQAMDMAGLTQVQVAEKTGLTQPQISRIQNGHYSDLPGETMRTLADLFKCSIEDLFPAREALAS